MVMIMYLCNHNHLMKINLIVNNYLTCHPLRLCLIKSYGWQGAMLQSHSASPSEASKIMLSNLTTFAQLLVSSKFRQRIISCNNIYSISSVYTSDVVDNRVRRTMATKPSSHSKCRNSRYPSSTVDRTHVDDNKISWDVDFAYQPISYTAPSVLKKPEWADPDIEKDGTKDLKWNKVDDKYGADRTSFTGVYEIHKGLPRNPVGRTGMVGRGLLGRWGPNHAADPIVTRWLRDEQGAIVTDPVTKKQKLQFVSIKRKDTGNWALPGGMVDTGELITSTLKREFQEEALSSLTATSEEINRITKDIDRFFANGKEMYRGYVDDPRNTDNAWLETIAMNFHDDDGDGIAKYPLNAGDDAVGVQWLDIDRNLDLHANHKDFVKLTVDSHNAHW